MGEPDAKTCDQDHHQPAYQQCFCDLEFPKNREINGKGVKYPSASYIYVHLRLSPPVFLRMCSF